MKKGISLVVLVITIIVMITIAGAIIISLNDTNVIDQADNAVATHNVAAEKEMIIMAYNSYEIEKLDNPAAKFDIEGATIKGNAKDGWTIIFESDNRYILSADGELTADGVQEYEKVDWKYAWTSDGTTWSDIYKGEKLEKGTKVEGQIVAKIYETDEIAEAVDIDEISYPAGKGYMLEIEGKGEIPSITNGKGDDESEYYAWVEEFLKNCEGEQNDPISPYIIKLTIAEGITNIPENIGVGCKNLKELIMPSTLTEIPDFAFNDSAISNLVIPDNVNKIGKSSFRDCKNLQGLTIGSGVVEIGNSAFSGCSQLDNLIIPSNVEIIEHAAFELTGIKNIIIPDTVKTMGSYVFANCSNLENVYIEITSEEFSFGGMTFDEIADNSVIYVRSETIANKLVNNYTESKTTISSDYNWTASAN